MRKPMGRRALLALAVLPVVGMLLAGCAGTTGPPVDTTTQLQELVQVDQTLGQVQELMTDALRGRATIYPAENIKKQENGNWVFAPTKSGSAGDTDAPYLVLLFEPDPDRTDYFAVFFQGGRVTASEWFDNRGAYVIRQLLGNLLDLTGDEQPE